MIKLHHWPLSPFCRKVRLVMAEKKIVGEIVISHFWEATPDFMRSNPYGTVPFFRDQHCALGESSAICEYLEEIEPEPTILPGTPAERAEARRISAWFDDRFHRDVTSKLLYERAYRRQTGQGSPDSQAIIEGIKNIKLHFQYITHLLDNNKWLAGENISIADFSAAAHISALDYISNVDWNTYATIKSWYATIKSRPCFRDILRDVLPYLPQPSHYQDLDF